MKKNLFALFVSFIKIGSIAFGGGYTVFPLLQKEAVEYRKWINNDELMDMMAIAQTLPGVLYVNAATMVGYRVAGYKGAIVATIAGILPTLLLTLTIVIFFWDITTHPLIQKAINGILVGVSALIIHSVTKMWSKAVGNIMDLLWVVISTILLIVFNVNAAVVILGLGFCSFSCNLIRLKRKGISS